MYLDVCAGHLLAAIYLAVRSPETVTLTMTGVAYQVHITAD